MRDGLSFGRGRDIRFFRWWLIPFPRKYVQCEVLIVGILRNQEVGAAHCVARASPTSDHLYLADLIGQLL